MSGFAGFTNYTYRRENTELVLKRMSDAMIKRGADIEAFYDDRYTHIAYRCKTPKDIAEKKKAMVLEKEEAEYIIVWDGILQNKKELQELLKQELQEDEAIVLAMFDQYGERFVEYLQGVFAFAIWNKKSQTLYLARDALGVKPLFYKQQESNFIFASEIKSLIEFPDVPRGITEYGIANMFLKGLGVASSKPLWKEIQEVENAEYILLTPSQMVKRKYVPKEMQRWNMPVIQLVEKNIEITEEEIKTIVKSKDVPSRLGEDIFFVKECEKVREDFSLEEILGNQNKWEGELTEREKILSPHLKIDLEELYQFQKKKEIEKPDYSAIDRIANRFGYPILCPQGGYTLKRENIKNILLDILENPNSPLLSLVHVANVKEMLDDMSLDFMSYLIEINIWLEEYAIKID